MGVEVIRDDPVALRAYENAGNLFLNLMDLVQKVIIDEKASDDEKNRRFREIYTTLIEECRTRYGKPGRTKTKPRGFHSHHIKPKRSGGKWN